MKYTQTKIPDVWLLEPKVFGDERGFFMETFRQSEFDEIVGKRTFVQDNHSKSKKRYFEEAISSNRIFSKQVSQTSIRGRFCQLPLTH